MQTQGIARRTSFWSGGLAYSCRNKQRITTPTPHPARLDVGLSIAKLSGATHPPAERQNRVNWALPLSRSVFKLPQQPVLGAQMARTSVRVAICFYQHGPPRPMATCPRSQGEALDLMAAFGRASDLSVGFASRILVIPIQLSTPRRPESQNWVWVKIRPPGDRRWKSLVPFHLFLTSQLPWAISEGLPALWP